MLSKFFRKCWFFVFLFFYLGLALYTEEVNLQTFVIILYKTICRNYVPMHKHFYSSHWFLNNQMFLLFPIVETNANYAEICRVGNLEVIFQQVPLVQFF